jgi:hypothetical protein
LLCKKITVAESKEVKTGPNLTESSKEGCGSKGAVLPVLMMKKSTNYEAPHFAVSPAPCYLLRLRPK